MTAIPKVVPDSSGATVTATSPLKHLCPHIHEEDNGTVQITWTVDGLTIELHSLVEWLRTWEGEAISHEELTALIRDQLSDLGMKKVRVETTWTTAGMPVTVRA